MLPAKARLRKAPEFAQTLRFGRRAGHPALVVSALGAAGAEPEQPARVGFVVGRRIGGAVVRNVVRRRLQHLMAERLDRLPPGSRTVVRALPGVDRLRYAELGRELDRLLARTSR